MNTEQQAFSVFHRTVRALIGAKLQIYTTELACDTTPRLAPCIKWFNTIALSPHAKYLRGTLVVLGYQAAAATASGGSNHSGSHHTDSRSDPVYAYSIDLAAAYELFETAILIHDDVFDNADTRRGVATIPAQFCGAYAETSAGYPDAAIRATGEAAAVCMGDLAFYFLNQKLIDAYAPDPHIFAVLRQFNTSVMATIKGELLDIVLPFEEQRRITSLNAMKSPDTTQRPPVTDLVHTIQTLKTAEYTTVAPFTLGLLLGGAPESVVTEVRGLLELLGTTFQIQDDLLDLYGGAATGKPVGGDLAAFKMTLLYAFAAEDPALRSQLQAFYGKPLTPERLGEAQAFFSATGIESRIRTILQTNFNHCRALLADMQGIGAADKALLQGFIDHVEQRNR